MGLGLFGNAQQATHVQRKLKYFVNRVMGNHIAQHDTMEATYVDQLVDLPFDGQRNHDLVFTVKPFQSLFDVLQDLDGLQKRKAPDGIISQFCLLLLPTAPPLPPPLALPLRLPLPLRIPLSRLITWNRTYLFIGHFCFFVLGPFVNHVPTSGLLPFTQRVMDEGPKDTNKRDTFKSTSWVVRTLGTTRSDLRMENRKSVFMWV